MSSYEKMDPKAKKAWLTALRSGEYSQCQSALRLIEVAVEKGDEDKVGYCCLGVLCNLGRGRWVEGIGNGHTYVPYRSSLSTLRSMDGLDTVLDTTGTSRLETLSYFPPALVMERAGLDVGAAEFLAELNDSGAHFPQIADWIEKYL